MKALMCVLVVAGLTPLVMGALTFEANYDSGVNATVGGAIGVLLGNSTVSGGKLNVPTGGGGGAKYAVPATNFFNVTDEVSWGSNTVAAIVNSNAILGERQMIMSVAPRAYGDFTYSAVYGLDFWVNMQGQRPMFQTYDYWGSNGLNSLLLQSVDPSVVSGVDYFIACSWRDNGDGTVSMTIYQRQVGDMTGATAQFSADTSTNPGKPHNWSDSIICVGNRLNGANTYMEQTGGGIDLLRIYGGDFMSSAAGYDALYAAAVPEPASILLLVLGGVGLLRKRG